MTSALPTLPDLELAGMPGDEFIDISKHNTHTEINWLKVAGAGIVGAIARCGLGLHDSDPGYHHHVTNARRHMRWTGTYHVMVVASARPREQAQQLLAKSDPDHYIYAVDVERDTPLTGDEPAVWRDFLYQYLHEADSLIGPQGCTLYTYSAFLRQLALTPEFLRTRAGLTRRLWLAEYPSLYKGRPRAMAPRGPAAPWPAVWAWQWGGDANKATCPGVPGYCDRNTVLHG